MEQRDTRHKATSLFIYKVAVAEPSHSHFSVFIVSFICKMAQEKRVCEDESVVQAKRMKLQADESELRVGEVRVEDESELHMEGAQVDESELHVGGAQVGDESELHAEEEVEYSTTEDEDETETEDYEDEVRNGIQYEEYTDEGESREQEKEVVSRMKYRRFFSDEREEEEDVMDAEFKLFTKTVSECSLQYESYMSYKSVEEMAENLRLHRKADGILVLFEHNFEKRAFKIDSWTLNRFNPYDLCGILFYGYDVRNIFVFSLYYPEKKVKTLQQLASMKMGNGQQFWDLEIGERAKMGIWKRERLYFPSRSGNNYIIECEEIVPTGLTLKVKCIIPYKSCWIRHVKDMGSLKRPPRLILEPSDLQFKGYCTCIFNRRRYNEYCKAITTNK